MFKLICALIVCCFSVCLIFGEIIPELPHCHEKNPGTILVSTLDGNLSALNYSGDLLWHIPTGPGPLLVSNIHSLELTNNGEYIRIIPSLSGLLYKFDGSTLDPIQISAESLLKSSFKYSDDLVMAGAIEIRTYGVGFDSGKILYECSQHNCKKEQSTQEPEDVLLVTRKTQTIRAIEPKTGTERWNFSVGLHNIQLSNPSCMDLGKTPDLNLTVSMPDGMIAAKGKDIGWRYTFHSPIVSVWKWDGKHLSEINLFAPKNMPNFVPPSFIPAVYLAMHNKQLYIHEPVIMQNALHGKESHDLIVVESTSLSKIPWKPIPVNDMNDESSSSLTSMSVLHNSVYVDGKGYFLLTEQDYKKKTNPLCDKNNSFSKIIPRLEVDEELIVDFLFSWWKELLLILLTLLGMNLMWCFKYKKQASTQEIVYVPVERRVSERESEPEIFKSRYTDDFDTIRCLGKGGFGVVFEVRQKIDECSYAIKRITLPDDDKSKDRVMREVKALAKLEHKNIVRYFNSWLEHPPVGWKEEHDKSFISDITETTSQLKSEQTSSFIKSRKKSASISISIQGYEKDESLSFDISNTNNDDSYIVFEGESNAENTPLTVSNSTITTDVETMTDHNSKKINWRRPSRKHHSWDSNISLELESPTFLYIQMQLCQEHSLKEWLINKQERNYRESLDIFSQILSAVEYVHLRGLIHRDLKPSNIFFALDGQIKVGDFGLVKDMEDSFEAETKKNNNFSLLGHTKEVGTRLYMSPEQFKSRNYDYKVDIYSLGLIFLELLVPFTTESERIDILSKVKNGDYPKNFEKTYPNEYAILKEMLCTDPKKRLTTIGISAKAPFNKTTYGEEYHYTLPNIHKN